MLNGEVIWQAASDSSLAKELHEQTVINKSWKGSQLNPFLIGPKIYFGTIKKEADVKDGRWLKEMDESKRRTYQMMRFIVMVEFDARFH